MKQKTKPFGWCFVGTGTLANQVASQVCKSGRHEVVSVYTRRAESGEKFTAKHGGYYYATARDAMTADVVEKPFTMTAAEAKELVALAKKKGLIYPFETLKDGIIRTL